LGSGKAERAFASHWHRSATAGEAVHHHPVLHNPRKAAEKSQEKAFAIGTVGSATDFHCDGCEVLLRERQNPDRFASIRLLLRVHRPKAFRFDVGYNPLATFG
jgi:hypothetical protein